MKTVDAMIIGTGQAGPSLAVYLAKQGQTVAIAERKLFGRTCVNTGCIPTKAMIASAYVAHQTKRAQDFGIITSQNPHSDWTKIKARRDEIISQIRDGLKKWLYDTQNLTVYEDHARFVDPHTVDMNGTKIKAKKIYINVGARAAIPPLKGLDQVPYLTNSSILELDKLPEHLIIIGGSYIGLEFAQMFRRFGSRVTVIEKSGRLIAREDEDVSDTIKKCLAEDGIDIRLNTECMEVSKGNQQVVVNLACHGKKDEIAGSHLLMAVGRKPNTDDLGIEKASIKTDNRGFIKVDPYLQTTQNHIWALGECNGHGPFTHTAYNDSQIIIANLSKEKSRSLHDRIQAYALYLDPPLGRAGMTGAEIKEKGLKAKVAYLPMSRVKRATIKGQTNGFIKIYVDDSSNQILSAAILGPNGDEVIHTILAYMYAKSNYTVLRDAMHIHPTISELLPTALENLKPL